MKTRGFVGKTATENPGWRLSPRERKEARLLEVLAGPTKVTTVVGEV